MEGSANEEAAPEGAASGAGAAREEAANEQRAPGGSSSEGRERLLGASGEPGGGSTETSSSNGKAPPGGSANEQRDGRSAGADSANEDGGGLRPSANPDSGPEEPTNDAAGRQGLAPEAANHRREPRALTNEDAALEASANQDATLKAPTNRDAACRAPTNEDSPLGAPANQDTTLKPPTNRDAAREAPPPGAAANEAASRRGPASQGVARRDPANGASPRWAEASNEEAALPAPSNGLRDPWDWTNEESWLRAPVEEEGPEEQWAELGEEWEGLAEGAWPEEERTGPGEGPEAGDWWLSPDSAFSKRILRAGRGLPRPGHASLCRVLLHAPPPAPHLPPPAEGAGAGRWQTLRVGGAEGRWATLLDACLETMAAGERAWLRRGAGPAGLGVWLGRFTPAKPFWEEEEEAAGRGAAAPGGRWGAVEARAGRAAALLRAGAVGAAAAAYGQALRAAVAAGGAPPLPAGLARPKAELHAGLALCQLRLGLPAAAAANAGKALALRPQHLEARFRRALAAAAMSDLEAAAEDLREVLRAQPGHAQARRELSRVRGEARERDARLGRRLGRLFA